ncbi:MAG: type II toxin-antitoxin system VapB family antitoxin [Deltaproteobacteria bacterium]|nr:MAG: type II toxin-antitoxin system VapB family antitoxin [Deltaproteobacteria bacterium]
MRTTLDIPENLITEAMELSRISTKTGVIIAALESLIRKSKLSDLKKFKGTVNLDMDTLRNRKNW